LKKPNKRFWDYIVSLDCISVLVATAPENGQAKSGFGDGAYGTDTQGDGDPERRITRICVFGFWYGHFDEDSWLRPTDFVEQVSE